MGLTHYLKQKKYIAIPLQLNATQHFELNVTINKVKSRFIVDTGASNTCIDTRLKDYFNLTTQQTEVKASGAGATNMEAQLASKVKVKIGKWKSKKNTIVLLDLSHVNQALATQKLPPVQGIIGADVLQSGKAIIDYKTKKLYLKIK